MTRLRRLISFAEIKWENCICYGIKDYTGQMKVAVSGHLTNVNCNIGDKVRLVCFELTSDVNEWFLRAVRYSYMEVCTLGQQYSS